MPEQHIHFHAARRGNIAQIDDFPPAEPVTENPDNRCLGFNVISTDENMSLFKQLGRVNHYIHSPYSESLPLWFREMLAGSVRPTSQYYIQLESRYPSNDQEGLRCQSESYPLDSPLPPVGVPQERPNPMCN